MAESYKMIDGKPHLLHPADGKYYPIVDMTEAFASRDAGKTPEELAFQRAFEERRRQELKNQADGGGPVPGGVGFGTFYTSQYRSAFHTGTVIALDIICPQKAGGNVSTYLYLTETNRASKGVEALVYYYGQSELGFMIYDWAREDHWQVTLNAKQLAEFLKTGPFSEDNTIVERQMLSLQNQTFVTDLSKPNQWTNLVYLYNHAKQRYAMVYCYNYESSEAEQKQGWVGSWGPIVETFQDSYSGTNPLGFNGTYMQDRDKSGQWDDYHLLTDDISTIRNDQKGFKVVFLDPNYAFEVN